MDLQSRFLFLTCVEKGNKISNNSPHKGSNEPDRHPLCFFHGFALALLRIMQRYNCSSRRSRSWKREVLLDDKVPAQRNRKK